MDTSDEVKAAVWAISNHRTFVANPIDDEVFKRLLQEREEKEAYSSVAILFRHFAYCINELIDEGVEKWFSYDHPEHNEEELLKTTNELDQFPWEDLQFYTEDQHSSFTLPQYVMLYGMFRSYTEQDKFKEILRQQFEILLKERIADYKIRSAGDK